jgi:putative transposase
MVPDHPLNVQIFDFDALVLIDQFARLFEMKIASLPFHFQMLLPQPAYGFLCVIFRETLEKWSCELIEFNGEADHVHLLIQTNPTVELSKLINNLKTVSSRLIRRDFGGYLSRIYRKPVFWRRSYCLISSGGATIEKLRKYIEEEGSE